MQRKHRYFQVHFVSNVYYVRDNSSDRSTVVSDAPIFLDREVAWLWIGRMYSKQMKRKI